MKHLLLYVLLLFGTFTTSLAQEQVPADPQKREQKIRALYIAYITQEMKLTEIEAQKFWPVHAQFDTEVKGVNIEMAELAQQQAVLDIKKKYEDRFSKIVGVSRTNDFFKKDAEFRKKLIERLRKMRQQRNNSDLRPGKRGNF